MLAPYRTVSLLVFHFNMYFNRSTGRPVTWSGGGAKRCCREKVGNEMGKGTGRLE